VLLVKMTQFVQIFR